MRNWLAFEREVALYCVRETSRFVRNYVAAEVLISLVGAATAGVVSFSQHGDWRTAVCIGLLTGAITALLLLGIAVLWSAIKAPFALWSGQRARLAEFEEENKEVPLVTMLEMATSLGWSFGDGGVQLLDFKKALRESAIAGDLKVRGRPFDNQFGEWFAYDEPLQEIPADHWLSYELSATSLMESHLEPVQTQSDNRETFTQSTSPPSKKGYVDLQIGGQLERWLQNDGKRYQGEAEKNYESEGGA